MAFTNLQVDIEALPRFAEVEFLGLHPSYARVALGTSLLFLIPFFGTVTGIFVIVVVPKVGLSGLPVALIVGAILCFAALLAWHAYKSARMTRYAVRQHDVIVQSGIFWKKETVQPVNRIQHIEQHQGPIDKRYDLYELKLFSAGTGQFSFRIPGLDAESASRIRRFILDSRDDVWGAEAAPLSPVPEAHAVTDG